MGKNKYNQSQPTSLPEPKFSTTITLNKKPIQVRFINLVRSNHQNLINKKLRKVSFPLIQILHKITFRHCLTGNPKKPVDSLILGNIVLLDIGMHQLTKDFINNYIHCYGEKNQNVEIIGYQIHQGTAYILKEDEANLIYLHTASKPISKIYLEVPGKTVKKTREERMLGKYIVAYERNDYPETKPDRFLFDSRKYIITPHLFNTPNNNKKAA